MMRCRFWTKISEGDPIPSWHCQREARAIVTLDMGFADIRAYPPVDYSGIIVLRPGRQDKPHLLTVIRSILPMLLREPLAARLWIVDEVSVRIHS